MERSIKDLSFAESSSVSAVSCNIRSARYQNDREFSLGTIAFDIKPACVALLCGPNASGKTLLLRLLGGMHHEYGIHVDGRVLIGGIDIVNEPSHVVRQKVGMVFGRPATQLFERSVHDEVKLGLLLREWPWADANVRGKEMAQQMGLNALMHRDPQRLSGGEQQRTTLGAALAPKPSLLLLDEPTGYLDSTSRNDLHRRIRALADEGTAIIIASHRIEEELEFADSILVLDRGRLVLHGDPRGAVFSDVMESVVPSRAHFIVGRSLWESGRSPTKLVATEDYNALSARFQCGHRRNNVAAQKLREQPAILIKDLDVAYPDGTTGLSGVTVSIPQNSITLIVGGNGSGKTTLFRTLLKFVSLRSGTITIFERDFARLTKSEISQLFSLMPQDPGEILFHDTLENELVEAAKRRGIVLTEDQLAEVLQATGLWHAKDRPPEILSLGQQRQLTIALSLISETPVLLCDEPELALDSDGVREILKVFRRISKSRTVLIASHDLGHFFPVADHLVIMEKGCIVAQGDPFYAVEDPHVRRTGLAIPPMFSAWKCFSNARTWEDLAAMVVREYNDEHGN